MVSSGPAITDQKGKRETRRAGKTAEGERTRLKTPNAGTASGANRAMQEHSTISTEAGRVTTNATDKIKMKTKRNACKVASGEHRLVSKSRGDSFTEGFFQEKAVAHSLKAFSGPHGQTMVGHSHRDHVCRPARWRAESGKRHERRDPDVLNPGGRTRHLLIPPLPQAAF